MLRAIRAEQAAQREKLDEIISRIGALEREVATLTLRFAEMNGLTISITVSDGSSSA
jgi:ribulose kinase